MNFQPDLHVIQCNYVAPTKVAVTGARAYLYRANRGNGHDRILVLVRSRGRRWVVKWEAMARLGRFRIKKIPPEHPLYGDHRLWTDGIERLWGLLAELVAASENSSWQSSSSATSTGTPSPLTTTTSSATT